MRERESNSDPWYLEACHNSLPKAKAKTNFEVFIFYLKIHIYSMISLHFSYMINVLLINKSKQSCLSGAFQNFLSYWWSGVWISLFGKQSPLMEVHYFFIVASINLFWPNLIIQIWGFPCKREKKSVSSPCLKSSCFWTNKYMILFIFNVLPAFLLNHLLCVIEINDIGFGVRETGHLGLF